MRSWVDPSVRPTPGLVTTGQLATLEAVVVLSLYAPGFYIVFPVNSTPSLYWQATLQVHKIPASVHVNHSHWEPPEHFPIMSPNIIDLLAFCSFTSVAGLAQHRCLHNQQRIQEVSSLYYLLSPPLPLIPVHNRIASTDSKECSNPFHSPPPSPC